MFKVSSMVFKDSLKKTNSTVLNGFSTVFMCVFKSGAHIIHAVFEGIIFAIGLGKPPRRPLGWEASPKALQEAFGL